MVAVISPSVVSDPTKRFAPLDAVHPRGVVEGLFDGATVAYQAYVALRMIEGRDLAGLRMRVPLFPASSPLLESGRGVLNAGMRRPPTRHPSRFHGSTKVNARNAP